MNTKEVKPRTLVAVLAAAIREEAESIAKKIVEEAKSDNVEYASLVESFILNKRDAENITFSSFAENAFEQIKDIKELKTFSVALECKWRKRGESEQFIYESQNEFSIRSSLNIKTENGWDKSALATGNNAYSVFDEFKEDLHKEIEVVSLTPTEVNLPTEGSKQINEVN